MKKDLSEEESGSNEDKKTTKNQSLKNKDKDKKLEETTKKENIKDHAAITYASHEQLLAENFYKSNVDYDNLFSYTFAGVKANDFSNFYEEKSLTNLSNNYEDMDTEEAKETLVSIQYASVLGSKTEMSIEKRRQFATWITFNKDLMGLFENLYGVTGDVDYSKTF